MASYAFHCTRDVVQFNENRITFDPTSSQSVFFKACRLLHFKQMQKSAAQCSAMPVQTHAPSKAAMRSPW